MHEPLLRPVQASDRDFLLQLYLGCRADEGRRAGLPEALWQGLLRQQFAIREQQYGAAYPRADDRLVLGDAGQAIGRFYVDRSAGALLQLIDIALLPAHQGQGLGRALLLGLQREAAAGEQTIELHVASDNPAARLYESLGFVDMAEPAGRSDHPYRRLRWRAACTV
jgi:GNAT superfamily N-acetyltransferase